MGAGFTQGFDWIRYEVATISRTRDLRGVEVDFYNIRELCDWVRCARGKSQEEARQMFEDERHTLPEDWKDMKGPEYCPIRVAVNTRDSAQMTDEERRVVRGNTDVRSPIVAQAEPTFEKLQGEPPAHHNDKQFCSVGRQHYSS